MSLGIIQSKSFVPIAVIATISLVIVVGYGSRRLRRSANRLRFSGDLPRIGSEIGKVEQINIFPGKSMRQFSCQYAAVDKHGLKGDRLLMVVNEKNVPITQRACPKLACVQVDVEWPKSGSGPKIYLSTKDSKKRVLIDYDQLSSKKNKAVDIYLHGIKAYCIEAEIEAHEWICETLKRSNLRLVVIAKDCVRHTISSPIHYAFENVKEYDGCSLGDVAPLSLGFTASMNRLNEVMDNAIDGDRFRCNVWIKSEIPFVEDVVGELQIGSLTFRCMNPISRCVIPTINQETGEAGFHRSLLYSEPTKSLRSFRSGSIRFGLSSILNGPGWLAPLFGIYVNVSNEESEGIISIGDPVRFVSYRDDPWQFSQYRHFFLSLLKSWYRGSMVE